MVAADGAQRPRERASADADADEGAARRTRRRRLLARGGSPRRIARRWTIVAARGFLYAATTLKETASLAADDLFYSQHLRGAAAGGPSLDGQGFALEEARRLSAGDGDEGLCEVGVLSGEEGRGRGIAVARPRVCPRHADAYRAFVPWEATAAAAEADGGGGGAPLRADDVYRPREHQRPVFDGQGGRRREGRPRATRRSPCSSATPSNTAAAATAAVRVLLGCSR